MIEFLDEIDDGPRGMRMAGEEFRLGFDTVGQFVELGVGAALGAIGATMRFIMTAEGVMEFVMPVGVVKQNDASGRRLTVTPSIPGITANVSLTCFNNSGLPLPAGIFIRTRPGT
ncbi:MAG TPA: hypothetical protein VE396_20125 [Xanthobacteraceae bacterium]|nr:hypothetical protein [Xanthobacteraceae bacterium]